MKGTHLLYMIIKNLKDMTNEFPSPRRGPIFSTQIPVAPLKENCKEFPSPRRGPIFSTRREKLKMWSSGFRPHEEDPSSLRNDYMQL